MPRPYRGNPSLSKTRGTFSGRDGDEIEIADAERTGVIYFAKGSSGCNEPATVQACQCPPIATRSSQQAGHWVDVGLGCAT